MASTLIDAPAHIEDRGIHRDTTNPSLLDTRKRVYRQAHLLPSQFATPAYLTYDQPMPFTHLEVHSHFTLLGATPSPADLARRAAADGLAHLALTDTDVVHGVVAFARACKAAGLQPVIGMAATVADAARADAPPDGAWAPGKTGKLVLLARDAAGYRSLCRLSSLLRCAAWAPAGQGAGSGEEGLGPRGRQDAAGRGGRPARSAIGTGGPERWTGQAGLPAAPGEGSGEPGSAGEWAGGAESAASAAYEAGLERRAPQPRASLRGEPGRRRALTWDELRTHREGLICLSGGQAGWVERYLRAGNLGAAQVYAARLAGIFGEDACIVLELGREAQGAGHPLARPPGDGGAFSGERMPEAGPQGRAPGGLAGQRQGSGPAEALSREEVRREVVGLARRLGLPLAAVQPAYCLAEGDAERLRLLAAIRCNCRLADVPEEERPCDGRPEGEWHWLGPREMAARYARYPEALAETGEIAARCGEVLPDGRLIWPAVALPPGQTADEALAALARAGLAARYGAGDEGHAGPRVAIGNRDEGHAGPRAAMGSRDEGVGSGDEGVGTRRAAHGYGELGTGVGDEGIGATADGSRAEAGVRATPGAERHTGIAQNAAAAGRRLEAELAAIAEHGYAPLFLVVADIVRHAREHDIPTSTRGSVANSLVAYCAGITTVDPIAHDLLFERFLSPGRRDPPDIDLDLCSRRRDEVLAYLRDAYGAERVALVGTVSTLRLASAVREVAKAYGLPEPAIAGLAARLPQERYGPPGAAGEQAAALLEEIGDPAQRAVLAAALELAGQPDHMGIHAGGVIITPGPLTDLVPLQWAPKGFLTTQFEHGDLAALGLPKLDLLGVRALTALADAAALVRRHHEPAFTLEGIPPADAATGDLLEAGDTIGVFQCESDGARATLRKLRARTERDLAIANAFFKPGPGTGGMAQAFVRRYRGEEPATYLHPALAPILGPTKGVMIFQEQVLRIAHEVAGLSWVEADHVRRGISKFSGGELTALAASFMAGCRRPPPEGPGMSEAQAATLWEQVAAFAGYGFNQGHATAYATVSYRAAYLRAHWPAVFLCARLADAGGFHHPVIYMAEAIRLGKAVRPPHVNHSGEQVSLEEGDPPALWLGLAQVRDLRRSAILAIVKGRERGPYTGLADLLARVALQPREIAHLVGCGALDGLGPGRAALLAAAGRQAGAGSGGALQLAFDFAEAEPAAESPAQRCAWEEEILGIPLAALADPLALLATSPDARGRAASPAPSLPEHVALARLFSAWHAARRAGGALQKATPTGHPPFPRPALVLGVRLPGWTGGRGFFFWDGATLVTARGAKGAKTPRAWQLLALRGRPAGDGWGTTWLEVEDWQALEHIPHNRAL